MGAELEKLETKSVPTAPAPISSPSSHAATNSTGIARISNYPLPDSQFHTSPTEKPATPFATSASQRLTSTQTFGALVSAAQRSKNPRLFTQHQAFQVTMYSGHPFIGSYTAYFHPGKPSRSPGVGPAPKLLLISFNSDPTMPEREPSTSF
jgi:hypothetical protein